MKQSDRAEDLIQGLTRLLLSIAGLVTQWTQPDGDGDGDAVENVA